MIRGLSVDWYLSPSLCNVNMFCTIQPSDLEFESKSVPESLSSNVNKPLIFSATGYEWNALHHLLHAISKMTKCIAWCHCLGCISDWQVCPLQSSHSLTPHNVNIPISHNSSQPVSPYPAYIPWFKREYPVWKHSYYPSLNASSFLCLKLMTRLIPGPTAHVASIEPT